MKAMIYNSGKSRVEITNQRYKRANTDPVTYRRWEEKAVPVDRSHKCVVNSFIFLHRIIPYKVIDV
jgi:hypothetical protein